LKGRIFVCLPAIKMSMISIIKVQQYKIVYSPPFFIIQWWNIKVSEGTDCYEQHGLCWCHHFVAVWAKITKYRSQKMMLRNFALNICMQSMWLWKSVVELTSVILSAWMYIQHTCSIGVNEHPWMCHHHVVVSMSETIIS